MLDPNELQANSMQTKCIQSIVTLLERFRSVVLNLLLTLKLANQGRSQRRCFSKLPLVHRSPPQIVLNYVVSGYFHRLLWCSNMNFPHLIRVIGGSSQPFSSSEETKMNCGHFISPPPVLNPLSLQKCARTHLLFISSAI